MMFNRACKICGAIPILDELYCYPCSDEVAEMMAEWDDEPDDAIDDEDDDA